MSTSVIALLHGPDQPGLVAKTAGWIHQRGGNVLHADQHLDRDENGIRSEAVLHSVPVITTLGSAFAALQGIRSIREKKFSVKSLQAYHPA